LLSVPFVAVDEEEAPLFTEEEEAPEEDVEFGLSANSEIFLK